MLLGGATAAWPLTVRAQQQAMPAVGFLNQGSANADASFAVAFRRGLRDVGFVEGQNVVIEYRWAEGHYNRLPELAADLVRRQVSVIASAYAAATRALKGDTSEIPIVFLTGTDPVRSGLVSSINRPGGKITGVAFFNVLIAAKRLGLLHELVPAAKTVALLFNPTNPLVSNPFVNEAQSAAGTLGLQLVLLPASTEEEISNNFVKIAEQRVGALMVATDAFFSGQQRNIVALAARYAIPTTYDRREVAVIGGLMSYGTDFPDGYRQQGAYVGRILSGEKAADLPVTQSTKFQFVLNLKTAKTLGLKISDNLLSIADEVIE